MARNTAGENSSLCEEWIDKDCNIVCLQESDIPGASLNGRNPRELNVTQLRRWLSCRGALVTGNKPELIERY